MPGADERLDELYRERPDGFVAGRDALAKELRAAGDRDEAAAVKKLRRPSVAAWLINRVALTAPAKLEELAEASRDLEGAQSRALEGEEKAADEWRAAAAREREAIESFLAAAEATAGAAGDPASRQALERVETTLHAATADPELRDRVARGRVEREQSGATLGTPSAPPAPTRGAGSATRQRASAKRRDRSAKRRELAQARRELERLEAELDEAAAREERLRGRVEETTAALRREKVKLAESKREAAGLKRRVRAAKRRADE